MLKLTDPEVTRHPKVKDNWIVTKDYTYVGHTIILLIARGFLTDLASIPRFLWWLIAPFELSITAPVVHDMLYRMKGHLTDGRVLTRKQVDDLFLSIMKDEGIVWWRRYAAWSGVRAGGASSWGANKVTIIPIEE